MLNHNSTSGVRVDCDLNYQTWAWQLWFNLQSAGWWSVQATKQWKWTGNRCVVSIRRLAFNMPHKIQLYWSRSSETTASQIKIFTKYFNWEYKIEKVFLEKHVSRDHRLSLSIKFCFLLILVNIWASCYKLKLIILSYTFINGCGEPCFSRPIIQLKNH